MSWDRLAPAVLPLLLPVGFLGMFVGETAWPLVAVAAVALVLFVVARRTERRPPEIGWTSAVGPAARAPERDRARRSVPVALAGVEIRELLLSPWFQGGAAFCVIFLVGITSYERSWWGTAALMPLLVHPLCGLTVVAVQRNVSRARRDGADDLYRSCPATTSQRLGGHLLSGVVPIVTATLFVTVSLVGASVALDHIYGPVDARVAADVAIAALLLPAGAAALGVLLGRLLPFALVPIVAVALIAAVDLEFWDEPDGRGWLATGGTARTIDMVYVDPPVLGRVIWTLGLVVATAAGALWVGRRHRTATLGVGVGSALAVAGIVVTALGPDDATAQRLAAYVVGGEEHTTCRDVSSQVAVCVPDPYRDHGGAVAAAVAPVAASIPADARTTPLTLAFPVDDVDELQRPVRRLVDGTPVPDGVVPLSFGHHDGEFDVARLDLAAAAVGIPVGPDAPGNVLVDGQARGVVMLWLATAGLDAADTRAMLQPGDLGDPSLRGHIWPSVCGADIQWSAQDLAAARTIATADRAVTADVVARGWGRWTDPATTTDELLAALGHPAVGPPDAIEPLTGECV